MFSSVLEHEFDQEFLCTIFGTFQSGKSKHSNCLPEKESLKRLSTAS